MSIDKPANERLKLYNRFKKALRSGDESIFFDADDLIIIIDQAADLQDEYTEIEAIMRGYRFFPDNEELAARRALLYYDLSLDEGVDNIRSHLDPDSPMARILKIRRLQSKVENYDQIIALLDEIVDDPALLDDEEVIQLVECAGGAVCYPWLKSNEKKLRKKTDYLPTLLYEIFIVADMNGDREYSIALLEELTELQPFNIDFWNALAQVLADNDGFDDIITDDDLNAALNALDFALAIESDNPEALTLKASILIKKGKAAEAAKALRPLIDAKPTAAAAQVYACALLELKRTKELNSRLGDFCEAFPDNSELIDIAIATQHPVVQTLINNAYVAVSEGDDNNSLDRWSTRAEEWYRRGRLPEAINILELLHHYEALSLNGYKMLFTALYIAGKYRRCIELYDELKRSRPGFLIPDMILALIMSYLRLGNKDDVRKAIDDVTNRLPMNLMSCWTMATSVESIGMNNFLTAIKTILDGCDDIEPDMLEIFEFPYTQSSD